MAFVLKKFITAIITLPGLFIVILIITGGIGLKKRHAMLALNLVLGLVLYALSIIPVANFLMESVEMAQIYRGKPPIDVIIMLGGGLFEDVEDLSGRSIPSAYSAMRIIDTVRLARMYRVPIILSGGGREGHVKEAPVYKRWCRDLGIDPSRIIVEDRSLDTVENARQVKKIFRRGGFRRGLLVTSAFHMRRSLLLFQKEGVPVVPHTAMIQATGLKKREGFDPFVVIPQMGQLNKSAMALRELIGHAVYALRFALFDDRMPSR